MRRPNKPWTEQDRELLQQYRDQGLPNEEIGKLMDRSKASVSDAAVRYNLTTRPKISVYRYPNPQEWPEEKLQQLEILWNEGVVTAEIGRRLGVTKNAVIGKARRIGLAARQSPIGRAEPKPRVYKPRVYRKKPTLPPLQTDAIKPIPEPPPPTRTPEMSTPVLPFRSQRKCAYIPADDTGPWVDREPNWCNKPVKAGSSFSYCEEHHALCSRPTPRQAAAA